MRIRLKAIFNSIPLHAGVRGSTTISMADNDANCLELLWFCDRYPLQISPDDLRTLKRSRRRQRKRVEQTIQILSGAADIPDADMAVPPRHYQAQAAAMVLTNGHLLLVDDLGLGKTVCALRVAAEKHALPALAVVDSPLTGQWADEVRRFLPHLRVHVIKQRKFYDIDADAGGTPHVLVISYAMLAQWSDHLLNKLRFIVFDEIQELRTGHDPTEPNTSKKNLAAAELAATCEYRMGLTATPIYNYGAEIWNIVDTLAPGILGTRMDFLREWCRGTDQRKAEVVDPQALSTYLRDAGIMLRRTRKEVGRELPPLTRVIHEITPSEKLDFWNTDTAAVELANLVLDSAANAFERGHAGRQLDIMLRQVTGVEKAPDVAAFVRMLLEQGDNKVLLYGWHREVYRIWGELLADFEPAWYTGHESASKKRKEMLRFVEGDCRLLVMSLRSGRGLNRVSEVCSTIVHGELDWSPGVHEQCLSEDTQVLTPDGFKGPDEIQQADLIAAFDPVDSSVHWVKAQRKFRRPLADGEAVYSTETKRISLCVTADHKMVVRRKRRAIGSDRSSWQFVPAKIIAGRSRRFIPTCGHQQARGVDLTDYELRLIGWFLTDGSFDGRALSIYQEVSKPWNQDIEEVLNGCGLSWSRYQRTNPNGVLMNMYVVQKGVKPKWTTREIEAAQSMEARGHTYTAMSKLIDRTPGAIEKKLRQVRQGTSCAPVTESGGPGWSPLEKYLDKNLSPLLEDVTREQLAHLLHGIYMGDGSKASKLRCMRITNTNEIFLERLQSLCVRRGYSANLATRGSKTKSGRSIYDLWISEKTEAVLPRSGKENAFEPCSRVSSVWCLQNELGTLVTRRNGKVSIVGNCDGRAHRDGQKKPVFSYYVLSRSGTDPVVSDVLGLKTSQLQGLRDPDGDPLVTRTVDPDHVRRLAETFLANRKKKRR